MKFDFVIISHFDCIVNKTFKHSLNIAMTINIIRNNCRQFTIILNFQENVSDIEIYLRFQLRALTTCRQPGRVFASASFIYQRNIDQKRCSQGCFKSRISLDQTFHLPTRQGPISGLRQVFLISSFSSVTKLYF